MRNTGILIILALLIPGFVTAQQVTPENADITGLWKGTLYNDTTKQFYRYEIAISEEKKGKLTGFSHTWFIVDDQQYYGVKKIRIKRDGDKLITEDLSLIANNYPEAPAKGVRQLNVLTLQFTDSLMLLSGPFSTNQTRIYSPLTGTIRLERKNDYRQSSLVPHLQELGLEKSLSFVKPMEAENPVITTAMRAPEKPLEIPVAKAEVEPEKDQQLQKRDVNYQKRADENKPELPKDIRKNDKSIPVVSKVIPPVESKPETIKPSAAADAEKRQTVVQQVVSIRSDSLQISLYDNGEVDGDTVSVLLNGKLILEKQGLSTKAVRKTIYLPEGVDTVRLVMYAESLGSIPPNTGLLVIRDGQDIYEVRFSGDLQKNAGILLRRRK